MTTRRGPAVHGAGIGYQSNRVVPNKALLIGIGNRDVYAQSETKNQKGYPGSLRHTLQTKLRLRIP